MLGIHRAPATLFRRRAARGPQSCRPAHHRLRRAWTVECLEGRALLSGVEPLTFSVNLQTGVGDAAVPPYITYQSPTRDSNGDGWYETALKINLNGSPYDQATFHVQYAGSPNPTGGVSVNIGDSSTNDTGSGDAGTQSNDAEVSVGRGQGFSTTFSAWGRDGTPTPGELLAEVPNFAANGVLATFVVRNNFVSWDNGQGVSGSLDSPYLFALAGQPDSEGPVNYDIYAAFNRVIAGDYRFGTGVGQVTVTLSPVDTTAPVVSATANPAILWPPNGQMVDVTVSGSISDDGSGLDPNGASYAVADEYGQVQPTGAVTVKPDGTYTVTVQLMARRDGSDRDGRQYAITVSALDLAGNQGSATTLVAVPHDQRGAAVWS